jgi:hypothetical protein
VVARTYELITGESAMLVDLKDVALAGCRGDPGRGQCRKLENMCTRLHVYQWVAFIVELYTAIGRTSGGLDK